MNVFDLLKNRIEEMEKSRDLKGLILALQNDAEQICSESASALGIA
jgi:hypothetical protein